ncbi:MAG: hypothetical protein MR266_02170 [Erysipelotrichaceae bacterium]|nr:hypothetical protein [Erysipelotrichaceae bacterium]
MKKYKNREDVKKYINCIENNYLYDEVEFDSLIEDEYNIPDLLTLYLEQEEKNYLRSIINNLKLIEKRYIYLKFGFLDRVYSNDEIKKILSINTSQLIRLRRITLVKLKHTLEKYYCKENEKRSK